MGMAIRNFVPLSYKDALLNAGSIRLVVSEKNKLNVDDDGRLSIP